jgi:hypothetical protein
MCEEWQEISVEQGRSDSQTKANANARAQYQSLFPFDSVSPMVGGQLQPQK